MKYLFGGLITCAFLLTGVLFTGCGSLPDIPLTGENPPPSITTGSPSATNTAIANVAHFRVGETVFVVFSGPPTPLDPHQEVINEFGTINLPLIGTIVAVGKTAAELQSEIHDAYVPKYYVRLTVTVSVKTEDRFVYVAGEVQRAGRVGYYPNTTVTKAIQDAGGLTDFASHSKVWLTHHVGSTQRIQVDYDKAIKDPAADPIVYPDDQIYVDKSW
jgi:protein involved in polysaccharide export with SLBB domain